MNNIYSMIIYHSFTMERSGNGFKTIEYRNSINKSLDHFSEDPVIKLDVNKRHRTLASIKKDFDGALIFTCVIDGHIQAPSALIQFIVECSNNEELNKIRSHYMKKGTYLSYDYHPEYSWLSDVPKDVLKTWCEY